MTHGANALKDRGKMQQNLIEAEMRNYMHTKQELDRLRACRRKNVSTATLLYLERTLYALDAAMEITRYENDGETRLKMLKMLYWERPLSPEVIMINISISKTTYYKWKREFIKLVGSILGYDV